MNPSAYLEMANTEASHWWFSGRRTILSKIIENLNLPPNAKILEIGCGTGGNLDMLAKFGEIFALEMDANALAIASKKTNNLYDIRAGHCPDNIPHYNQPFDLICMFDVLEHIDKDTETLIAAKQLLAKNGRILLTVPAYQWLWGAHDEYLHHKRRYLLRNLQEIARESGLTPIKLSYFNTLLFPLAVIVRLKEKIFRSANASGAKVPFEPLNSILRAIFSFERNIILSSNLPFGVSLIGIFTRNEHESPPDFF